MKLNRRNAIIGLGSAAVGTGALLGTGAFTTVEAQRDVAITTKGDDDALVQLATVDGREDFVNLDGSDQGAANINLGEDLADSDAVPGDGLNESGVTTIDDVIRIVNAGTQSITLSIHDAEIDLDESTIADLGDQPEGIAFYTGDATGLGVKDEPIDSVGDGYDGGDIESYVNDNDDGIDWEDISTTVGVAVDVGDISDDISGGLGDDGDDVTIVANAD